LSRLRLWLLLYLKLLLRLSCSLLLPVAFIYSIFDLVKQTLALTSLECWGSLWLLELLLWSLTSKLLVIKLLLWSLTSKLLVIKLLLWSLYWNLLLGSLCSNLLWWVWSLLLLIIKPLLYIESWLLLCLLAVES